MAKKKKTKAEQKEEQRQAMEAKRRETGWQPPEPELEPPPVLEDARTLFPDFGSPSTMDEQMSTYLATILDSDWMIDEPEFEAIYLPPARMAFHYVEEAEEAGFDAESFMALDEEERADTHLEFLSAVIDYLLTAAIEEDLLEAIGRLRERLLAEGDEERAARAGLVRDFMEQEESAAMWPSIGVVLAVGQRSLDAGFALSAAMSETGEIVAAVGDEAGPELQAVLNRFPGLVEYMAVYRDRIWEDGIQNLFMGYLWLDLFRSEELEPQIEPWKRAVEHDDAGEDEGRDARIHEITHHISQLLTPERVEEILADIETMVESGDMDLEDEQFLGMVMTALTDEETVSEGISALIAAFLGELRVLVADGDDGEAREDDE